MYCDGHFAHDPGILQLLLYSGHSKQGQFQREKKRLSGLSDEGSPSYSVDTAHPKCLIGLKSCSSHSSSSTST